MEPTTTLPLSSVYSTVFAFALGNRWAVGIYVSPGADDRWEQITYHVTFPDRQRALKLVDRILARGEIDLRFWKWHPSNHSAFGFMRNPPAAQWEQVA